MLLVACLTCSQIACGRYFVETSIVLSNMSVADFAGPNSTATRTAFKETFARKMNTTVDRVIMEVSDTRRAASIVFRIFFETSIGDDITSSLQDFLADSSPSGFASRFTAHAASKGVYVTPGHITIAQAPHRWDCTGTSCSYAMEHPPSEEEDEEDDLMRLILLGTVGLTVLIFLGFVAYWARQQGRNACRRRAYQLCSSRRNETLTEMKAVGIIPRGTALLRMYEVSENDFLPPDGFDEMEEIGTGSYCIVYKGTLRGEQNNETVAVKRSRPELPPEQASKTVLRELKILSRFQHPNIVGLRAACITDHTHCLILQYAEKGHLRHVLDTEWGPEGRWAAENSVDPHEYEKRFNLAAGIVNALEHVSSQGLLHRDVKPANVLVTAEWEAVLWSILSPHTPCS